LQGLVAHAVNVRRVAVFINRAGRQGSPLQGMCAQAWGKPMTTTAQARAADHVHGVVPPLQQLQLRLAAAAHDHQAIDDITDELARMGHCRPRRDDAWQTREELARALARMRGI
jgi:hypothetical protein